MSAARFFISAYRAALRLYPRPFQAEYAAEMASVFAESCQAAAGSPYDLFLIALRELRDLPFNLAREYRSQWSKKPMSISTGFFKPFPRAALRGMLGFALSFALVGLLFCALDTLLNPGKLFWKGGGSLFYTNLIIRPFALAFGLGVAVLGAGLGRRRAWISALVIFLLFTLLSYVFGLIAPVPAPGYLQVPLSIRLLYGYGTDILGGLLLGAVTGWIQRGWHSAGWYALAGAVGFVSAYLVEDGIASVILAPAPYSGNSELLLVGTPLYFAYEVLTALGGGAIIGLFLGLASAIHPAKSPAVPA